MTKVAKPYEVPLDDDFAREILAIPLDTPNGPPPKTLGERVQAALAAVTEANEYLQKSQLARIVADTLMKQLKKRGVASVRIRPDGKVVLQVAYEEEERRKPAPPVQRATRKSDLPKLDEMREEAEALGIDISDLGQQRRAVFERLQIHKEGLNGIPSHLKISKA